MSRLAWTISMLLVATSACGDDAGGKDKADGGNPTHPDASAGIADAGPGAPDARVDPGEPDAGPPPPQKCVVPTTGFGDLGALTVEAFGFEGEVNGQANIGTGTPPDVLGLQLVPGVGVFAAGAVTTGTFELTGAETAIDTCGACVAVLGDFSDQNGPKGAWMASGGKLTLTSVQTRLTGTLENATFVHVDLETGAPLGDDCPTSITKATFDAPIMAPR